MKVNELRIGNRCQWNKFASMGNGELNISIGSLSYAEFIDPIPLTEEWLVKLRFKPRKYKHKVIWTNQRNEVRIHRCVLSEEHFFRTETGYDVRFSPLLEYVHQLQNLYFALTGEELKEE